MKVEEAFALKFALKTISSFRHCYKTKHASRRDTKMSQLWVEFPAVYRSKSTCVIEAIFYFLGVP